MNLVPFSVVRGGAPARETLLGQGVRQTQLVERLRCLGEEGDGAAIFVLGGFGMLFDDADAFVGMGQGQGELVGGDETW